MRIDRDNSGTLSFDEILSYLKEVSKDVDEEYVAHIHNALDRNGDG